MKNKGQVVWTAPYKDAASGKTVVSAARAVYKNDKLVGVFSIDLSVQTLVNQVKAIKIGSTGTAALFDKKGDYVATPDKKLLGKNVSKSDYYKKMTKDGKNGVVHYSLKGEDKTMALDGQNHWLESGRYD